MIVSPIADRLVFRAVSARGAAVLSPPAAPRPHSLPVAHAALTALRNVVLETFRVTARSGRTVVAATVVEEIKLSKPSTIHGSNHGAENVGTRPQVVGALRNA